MLYISYGVATGFTRCDVVLFQFRPEFRRLIETHEVYLDILPRGRMQVTARVLVGYAGNAADLFGCDSSEGKLDAHHLYTSLALSIDTACQSKTPEFVVINLPSRNNLIFFSRSIMSFATTGFSMFSSSVLKLSMLVKMPFNLWN